MRQILFKAERLDNREVIIGDYYTENHLGIIVDAITYYDRLSGKNEYIQIDPNTLSQLLYTNKQGVKFFDGDVVKHTYYEEYKIRVFFSEELLAVMGQVFDDDGEYELITLLPSDFEKHINK